MLHIVLGGSQYTLGNRFFDPWVRQHCEEKCKELFSLLIATTFSTLLCHDFFNIVQNGLRNPFGETTLEGKMSIVLLQSFAETVAHVVVYQNLIGDLILSIQVKQANQWNYPSMYVF